MQLKFDKDLIIPDKYREYLAKMPDVLIKKESQVEFLFTKILITVGDVVTSTALKYKMVPKVSVVDFKTKRNEPIIPLPSKWERNVKVRNPPGCISVAMWNSIDEAIRSKGNTIIEVEGEEDLASIPAIVLAPDGAIVIYGVPDKGIAVYEVGEVLRRSVTDLISAIRSEEHED
ncbi:MAG: GTP-dependent dephospho-CoA kinase family protein [Thermoplasmatales archaeon]